VARSVLPKKGGGDFAVERVELNEAAIAAELLQVLAVFLGVTAKDIKPAR